MKQAYLFLFFGLLVLTQFSAFAQLQVGFHYKIKNTPRYQIRYSTTSTPTPVATTTTTTTAVAPTPATATAPFIPATITTTTTTIPPPAATTATTTIPPPAATTPIMTTNTNTQKHLIKTRLKAGIKQKGDSLLINFWSINPATDPVIGSVSAVNSGDGLGKYTIGANDYKSLYYIPINPRPNVGTPSYYVSLPYTATEIGVITIPFKYRSGPSSETGPNRLASAVNAGVYVGRKWGRTRFYADPTRVSSGWSFMLAAVATPTIISITDKNTNPVVTNPSDEVGFSLGSAALGSYGSFTVGLVGGWDFPATEQAKKWVYANKFWLGFGVGYKLGSVGEK